MVVIDPISEDELERARRLHNRFTAQSVSLETFRERFETVPRLFLLARGDSADPVGVTTGKRRSDEVAELAGLGVAPNRRRTGIGSRLLQHFENNAVEAGFERVSLGSAGGYVDRFYAEQGYEPESILVRLPADEPVAETDYEIAATRLEDGLRKFYIDVDRIDRTELEAVRRDFEDEEAIYIMQKSLFDG